MEIMELSMEQSWSTDAPSQYANNCTATDDVVVTVNPLPTIDLGADTTLICAGTSETIDAGTALLLTYGAMVLPIKLYRPPLLALTRYWNRCQWMYASDSMVIEFLM